MQTKILHIIEPTLYNQTGHSYSHIHSLLQANQAFKLSIQLWIDKRGNDLFNKHMCNIRAYFHRRWRRLQKLVLYLKLVRTPDLLFVGTSELLDLQIFAFYTKYLASTTKIFLYFHQFKQTPQKLARLRKIATYTNNIHIITPTQRLADIFLMQGFTKCSVVPCPTFYPLRNLVNATARFDKILYAGAARKDKGFPQVIALLQHMRKQNINTLFEIQISKPHSQRYDQATQQALQLLNHMDKNALILHTETLDQEKYLRLFNNAICLLLYDQIEYRDKFSGVTLDAFYAGCPIITVKDTWMGDTAEKFNAGIALSELTLENIQQAIDTIKQNYAFYQGNAQRAANVLRQQHDPQNTLAHVLG